MGNLFTLGKMDSSMVFLIITCRDDCYKGELRSQKWQNFFQIYFENRYSLKLHSKDKHRIIMLMCSILFLVT